jgi:hypothetical protein
MNAVVEHVHLERPVIAVPKEDGLLALVERALANPDVQVEKLNAILEMKMKWDAQQRHYAKEDAAEQAEREFTAAMVEFKKRVPQILKDKHVEFNTSKGVTSYDHATIGAVCDAIIPALAEAGLTHSWEPKQEGKIIRMTCTVSHPAGHKKSVSMESFADDSGTKNALQAIRSAQTYMERYTLLDVCGVATGGMPDDDGRASGPIRDAQVTDSGAARFYDPTKFNANFAKWSQLIESGRKTAADIIATVEAAAPLSDEQKKRITDIKPGSSK